MARQIRRIFVHCTASGQGMTVAGLRMEFRRKGWKNPGYHYVVAADGKITQMLDEALVSNGVQGYNSTSVNVAYIGGIDSKGKPTDNRTEAQKKSLRQLLVELHRRYPKAEIMGHRSIWGEATPQKWKKACPCFNAVEEYKDIQKQ